MRFTVAFRIAASFDKALELRRGEIERDADLSRGSCFVTDVTTGLKITVASPSLKLRVIKEGVKLV
jgi:hypothetical protein